MHREILNDKQIELLPLLYQFRREYYLVGGTAIALYLGHRRSIDFDLFKNSTIHHRKNIQKIREFGYETQITRHVTEQMNLIVNEVNITFFEYPYPIHAAVFFDGIIKIPDLIDLAAMKAFALGRRAKWKDYVDIFFLLKHEFTIKEISERAENWFGDLFSEKLFRAQLIYFNDIDYTEDIDFLIPNPPTQKEIQNFFIELSTQTI
jgi:predicted nucleotidyltransferase component of viral defense system